MACLLREPFPVRADWSSEVLGPFMEDGEAVPFLSPLPVDPAYPNLQPDRLSVGRCGGRVGFDFMEEMLRRWVTADSGSGLFGFLAELLSDTEQNWGVFTLFSRLL